MITPPPSISGRIATISPNMNPPYLADVTIKVTSTTVDKESIDNIVPPPRRIEPDGSSSEDLSLSNNNENNKIKSSSDSIIDVDSDLAKKANSNQSIKSRDPEGSVAGSIQRKVAEQDEKLNSVIHSLRPDPIINEENNSLISGMTNAPLANISDDVSLPTVG